MPKELDITALKQFEPKPSVPDHDTRREPTAPAPKTPWPSREPDSHQEFVALHIRAPKEIAEEFKAICNADRRSYAEMLKILMQGYQGPRT